MNRSQVLTARCGNGQEVIAETASEERKSRSWWRFTVALLLLPLLATGCFRPSSSTRTLRDCVMAAAGEGWVAEIELGVGPLTFGLARGGARFVELPDEARIVLRSMRGADVGIYRYFGVERPKAGAELLPSVNQKMVERGWERLVAVMDGRETVAVYVPADLDARDQLRLCVLVVDESEMVIVSARGNPEPLIRLALEKARESTHDHFL